MLKKATTFCIKNETVERLDNYISSLPMKVTRTYVVRLALERFLNEQEKIQKKDVC